MVDQENKEKILRWLNEKWQGAKFCPVCGHNTWSVDEFLGEIREFARGGLVIPGRIWPVIVVTCATCGNTILLNAIKAGVVEASTQQPASEQKPTQAAESEPVAKP